MPRFLTDVNITNCLCTSVHITRRHVVDERLVAPLQPYVELLGAQGIGDFAFPRALHLS
jgi:hypothetical protein